MIWFAAAAVLYCLIAWAIAAQDVSASIDRDNRSKHRHEFERVGYGGAGWSLYRCACGETDIWP